MNSWKHRPGLKKLLEHAAKGEFALAGDHHGAPGRWGEGGEGGKGRAWIFLIWSPTRS